MPELLVAAGLHAPEQLVAPPVPSNAIRLTGSEALALTPAAAALLFNGHNNSAITSPAGHRHQRGKGTASDAAAPKTKPP